MNFTACSEGEESENTEISGLKEILVGVWVQYGDDDIFVFNADGTGLSMQMKNHILTTVITHSFLGLIIMSGFI